MKEGGTAIYNQNTNELEVVRYSDNSRRKIRCTNFDPKYNKVYGVEVHGDEIWLLSSGQTNSRPNRKHIYFFGSLSGGSSASY